MKTKLVYVAPITKGVSGELVYFSSKKINAGDIVTIPLRKKNVPAVVIAVEGVEKTKTKLRQSSYLLKRVLDVTHPAFFSKKFIEASEETALYFATNLGNTIKEIVPQAILDSRIDNPLPETPGGNQAIPDPKSTPGPTLLLQASRNERIKFFRNLIRSEFAKKHSVFLCLPTSAEIDFYKNELSRGLEKYTYALSSDLGKKETRERWNKITREKHPVLIIATKLFLSIQRADVKNIIIENEGSPHYKLRQRPFVDIRKYAQNITHKTGQSLTLADEIIRTETFSKLELGKAKFAAPVLPKITSSANQLLVDMKKNKNSISEELKTMLNLAHSNNEHTILFINRRGYGLSTSCNECGKIILCPTCSSPLVLHTNEKNMFICHKCLLTVPAFDQCPYCKNWDLQTLGFGTQRVSNDIGKAFPNFKIFVLDSDTVKTKKQGIKVIEDYNKSPAGILVATELLFSFFAGTAERIAVVSIDGLFSLPDFRINEKIFRLLMRLKTMSQKSFTIQTRLAEHDLFKNVLKGSVYEFYRTELESRRALGYPPYKTLILISVDGTNKQALKNEVASLEKYLTEFNPISFPAFTSKIKNLHRFNILLKLSPELWPPKHDDGQSNSLRELLMALPPRYKVDVDPESIL